ncbi:MAG TPA: Trp family transcriptional regulator [Sedimentisphaerales bacterium]|nr:Trp family transcriptional regulator [Sedimentisphaerales bacterium]
MSEKKEVIGIFTNIKDVDTMEKFFGEIFTPSEIKTIVLRWQLMKMVNQKVPQRDVASKLGISLCKITRGAKILKDPDSVSSKLLNKKKFN